MHLIRKRELTKEEWCEQEKSRILQYVSEEDIVMGFWPAGRELKFNRAIISPFRGESAESFIIGNKYGCITYKDMGAYEYRGDCWKFVQQIQGLQKFSQVIAAIEKRFNIRSNSQYEEVQKLITWEKPKLEIKPPPHIQVTTRKFNKEELRYWASYYQDIKDLQREEIYAPQTIYRDRQKIPNELMTFCYYCADIGKWKLYRPLAPKKVKNSPPWLWKWDNSIGSLQYIENLNTMQGPIGICTKSRKDRLLLRKATGIDAICSIQAEDPAAMTDEALYQIWSNVDYKVAIMDNDQKGRSMSYWLTDRGYHHANVPYDCIDENGKTLTDFADMAKYYGIDAVTNYLKSKWII